MPKAGLEELVRYAIYINKGLMEYKLTCDGADAKIIKSQCCKVPMFVFWQGKFH